jgi:hypothetical protein
LNPNAQQRSFVWPCFAIRPACFAFLFSLKVLLLLLTMYLLHTTVHKVPQQR